MEIKHIECPSSKTKIKCPYALKPKFIVIHNTANDASAQNEIKYMHKNNFEKSFHFAVDDKEIVQGIALNRNAWHAGDGNGKGNREGIAIEICYSKSGGERFLKALKNAAELTAFLIKRYSLNIESVKTHKAFSTKHCPHRILDEYGWENFLKLVKSFLIEEKTENPDVYYRVRTNKKWLPEVKNLEDYAGITGKPITDIAIKVSVGKIKYRVHVKGGKWLPFVSQYNINDAVFGYAGNGKAIDAVEIVYTPSESNSKIKAYYRVSPLKSAYYSFQINNETSNGQDGYAGLFNKQIDRIQIKLK